MEVQVAALCDYAADYGGKLSAIGVFDTIGAAQFPVIHPHCAVALRILFRDDDAGQHQFKLSLIDEDGRQLPLNIDAGINVRLPENLFFVSVNMPLILQGLKFDRPGQYSVDIQMDGKMIARIPLQVVQAQPQPPPAA
jgi:hypothetical protein